MSVEIRVPSLGESVTEATVAKWFKQIGESVKADEPLVELETDKVTLEYNAPASGTLAEILVEQGGEVEVGALLGAINDSASNDGATAQPKAEPSAPSNKAAGSEQSISPSVRKLAEENNVGLDDISPTGPKGNITKGDVLEAIKSKKDAKPADGSPSIETKSRAPGNLPAAEPSTSGNEPSLASGSGGVLENPNIGEPHRREQRVKMTRLRRRIAERLKEAQNTAAMLTTYNEADMSQVMALRKRYQSNFTDKHEVKLGFMSFFVKATVSALKELPALNAEIDGDEIIYKNFYDIGVAVGTPSGLVVPILRDADSYSFAGLEKKINELGIKARDGKLAMDDLVGGTFTISNGGVYGSLMSSPILNPPQVGILGMHKIQERPVVVDGDIAIRPMMYLALSYDHRIVDGKEAVTFLVRLKECIEDPERLLLDV